MKMGIKILKWFEEIYNEKISKPDYRKIIPFELKTFTTGYLKKYLTDSSENRETKTDTDIMKDKENLLDVN
jgi:hypothetical protein